MQVRGVVIGQSFNSYNGREYGELTILDEDGGTVACEFGRDRRDYQTFRQLTPVVATVTFVERPNGRGGFVRRLTIVDGGIGAVALAQAVETVEKMGGNGKV